MIGNQDQVNSRGGDTIIIKSSIETLQKIGFTETGARQYLLELGANLFPTFKQFNETLKELDKA